MQKTKIMAMYLPQYHSIPENDEFWGKGFTDWITVRNAKPLFKGHIQPRIPLNNNYYDLSTEESVVWQAKIAKEHGVYGLGIYHYWFNNEKNLLTRPAQILYNNKDIDIHYFYAWDNISWKRSWSNVKEKGNAWAPALETERKIQSGPSILIPYIIGNEHDWKTHFDYLLPYFKDPRYVKKDNSPIFVIFHKDNDIKKMCDYWNQLSRKEGFNGIYFIFRYDKENTSEQDTVFKYEPAFSGWNTMGFKDKIEDKIRRHIYNGNRLRVYDYDKIWSKILNNAEMMHRPNVYHGAFVNYDDTPRRGVRGIYVKNGTPEKFQYYMSELLRISNEQEKDFIFLTAWNEWGEGAFLEPDEVNKYNYLNAIKNVINNS